MGADTNPLLSNQDWTEFYIWSFPGAPVQVHLSLSVVQDIRSYLAQASSVSTPVHGVLLGTIVTPGLPKITGFRPLPSGDAAGVQDAIACAGNADNLVPIGYFRTHAGERLALSPEDISLAETHFADPNCVFLLIDTFDPRIPHAGFFYWDRGKMNGGCYDFCLLEFPFDALLLRLDQRLGIRENSELQPAPPRAEPFSSPAGPRPAPTAAEPLAVSQPLEAAPSAARRTPPVASEPLPGGNATPVTPARTIRESRGGSSPAPRPGLLRRIIRPAPVAAVCFAAGMLFMQKLAGIVNTEPAPIALKVEHQGADLSVTWNHNAPLVSTAQSGRLTIDDGGTREFPLDEKRVRFASFVYSPRTDQVRVQLDIHTPRHRVVRESVQVILKQAEFTQSSVPVQAAKPAESQPAGTLPYASPAAAHLQHAEPTKPHPVMAAHSAAIVIPAPSAATPPRHSLWRPAAAPSNSRAKTQSDYVASMPVRQPSAPLETDAATPDAVSPSTNTRPHLALAGRWVFSPALPSGSPFRPASVTLVLREVNGRIHGFLSGRYKVPANRNFTPQVKINFEGPVDTGSLKFRFTAAGGIKGQIELIVLPGKQDVIEVVWTSERDQLKFDDLFFRVRG
jgi:hypothetical protein